MSQPVETDNRRQTRRTFCARTCQLVSAAALGGAVASLASACANGSPTAPGNAPSLPTVSGSLSNGSVTVTIDSASPLASVGSPALVEFPSGALLVVRTAQDAFTALSAICTHQSCTITGFANQLFICPCHGSEYDMSGHVVRGPAPASLAQYATTFSNGVLTITG
ncbi:MAG: ubiquinol-cytochrome c reductase iron-sulfur subunit [Betaproteobacteria bacterium]